MEGIQLQNPHKQFVWPKTYTVWCVGSCFGGWMFVTLVYVEQKSILQKKKAVCWNLLPSHTTTHAFSHSTTMLWNQLPRGSRVYDTFVPFTNGKHGGGDGKSTWLDNFAAGSSPPEMRLDIGGKWSGKAPFLCKPSVVTVTGGVSHRKICIWQVSDWVIESPECVFLKLLHHLLDKKLSFQRDILFYQPPVFHLNMATPLETVYSPSRVPCSSSMILGGFVDEMVVENPKRS